MVNSDGQWKLQWKVKFMGAEIITKKIFKKVVDKILRLLWKWNLFIESQKIPLNEGTRFLFIVSPNRNYQSSEEWKL